MEGGPTGVEHGQVRRFPAAKPVNVKKDKKEKSCKPASSGSPIAFLFMLAFGVGIYLFYCYCLKRIVEKCGEQPGAIIWIPVFQMIPLFRIAKMNPWMILLMLIPLVNLIVAIMLWVNVLKVLGRGPVMVLVLLLFGFIYLPYLAFSGARRSMPAIA